MIAKKTTGSFFDPVKRLRARQDQCLNASSYFPGEVSFENEFELSIARFPQSVSVSVIFANGS